jgi:hypothetical protein
MVPFGIEPWRFGRAMEALWLAAERPVRWAAGISCDRPSFQPVFFLAVGVSRRCAGEEVSPSCVLFPRPCSRTPAEQPASVPSGGLGFLGTRLGLRAPVPVPARGVLPRVVSGGEGGAAFRSRPQPAAALASVLPAAQHGAAADRPQLGEAAVGFYRPEALRRNFAVLVAGS